MRRKLQIVGMPGAPLWYIVAAHDFGIVCFVMAFGTLSDMSRFWVEKGAWKHREKHVVFFCAIDFLAQVHTV